MFLIFLFGFLGLIFNGINGLFVGALIGYAAGWGLRSFVRGRMTQVQDTFLGSTFAIMGALSKADGVVTSDEIAAAESIFRQLNLSPAQREQAKAAFNRGKSPGFDIDAEAAAFARAAHGQRPLLMLFLQIQCSAIAGDGNVHPAEHQMLVRVARQLGLSEADVAQLEALLRTGFTGQPGSSAPPSRDRLNDAYTALGLTPDASDADIKKAYRRLMSQNHPDKLAGKGLPESMRAAAEERTREIGAAYSMLKESRGFT